MAVMCTNSLMDLILLFFLTSIQKIFTYWYHQDKLLIEAFHSALTLTISPLITNATSCHETYANPCRGHIKHLQQRLNKAPKSSTQSIVEYMK